MQLDVRTRRTGLDIVSGGNTVDTVMLPSQKPTPSEYAVLTVLASLIFIAFGIVAIVVAARAPADKEAVATIVMRYGFMSLGIGVFIGIVFWLFRRFTN